MTNMVSDEDLERPPGPESENIKEARIKAARRIGLKDTANWLKISCEHYIRWLKALAEHYGQPAGSTFEQMCKNLGRDRLEIPDGLND